MLKDNAEVINGKKNRENDLVIRSAPLPGDALNLIDLAGTYCAANKNTDGSRFNILSAVANIVMTMNDTCINPSWTATGMPILSRLPIVALSGFRSDFVIFGSICFLRIAAREIITLTVC